MPPKSKEDKIQIRAFKDGSSDWFVNDAHYSLNEAGELIWCAGEVDKEELRSCLLSFILRNKKTYRPREKSLFETEERNWSTITFGKHKGLTLDAIKDIEPKYLRWLYDNTTDIKIKQELKEILKIK